MRFFTLSRSGINSQNEFVDFLNFHFDLFIVFLTRFRLNTQLTTWMLIFTWGTQADARSGGNRTCINRVKNIFRFSSSSIQSRYTQFFRFCDFRQNKCARASSYRFVFYGILIKMFFFLITFSVVKRNSNVVNSYNTRNSAINRLFAV